MPKQPLGEVFGFPLDNVDEEASRHRKHQLCPFNNRVANCTKDKANDPLGVCSILSETQEVIITCPVRFRERWLIAEDAASFFFPEETKWTSLSEVRLRDNYDNSAGNIDHVLVSYSESGRVLDFGALEIQAVYISGNVRKPFEHYMEDPVHRISMNWEGQRNYPRADYLSSSRKRLAPQLLFKGGIFQAWNKRIAVALNTRLFETLPKLGEVPKEEAEVAWLVYDLLLDEENNIYRLTRNKIVYTRFDESLKKITVSEPGNINDFVSILQEKITAKLDNPPDTETIDEIL